MSRPPLLAGVRVLESSLLGPAELGGILADLGAEVIKVEAPGGDYVRQMTWPIVEGNSLLHLHINRGKHSLVLDLTKPEGLAAYRELVASSDVIIEAMRPGALARRGLGFDQLKEINPKIVFCSISGYGATGPYKDMPSHGIAYDTWAGQVTPAYDDDGFCYMPEHSSIGIHAGPYVAALGILAAIIRARETGEGTAMEIAQSDAAAYFDWYRIETWKAYERPQSEVTGNASDNFERRPPGTAGMREGVRYQTYDTSDGHVLFMASEQAFWKNFAEGIGQPELFEKWPGSKFADHAKGNKELQAILRDVFKSRTTREWIEFGNRVNTPIAPVNTTKTIVDDPQFQARFTWVPKEQLVAEQLLVPLHLEGEELPVPERAPTVGEHTEAVLRSVLGYDDAKLATLRESGALG